MVSKGQIKLITGLQQKKYRERHGLFVAEGPKVISELRKAGFEPTAFFSTDSRDVEYHDAQEISEADLRKLSFLKTPNTSLAVFKIPENTMPKTKGLTVALDAVRDPGNLGTIIRMCDWFGVTQLLCSEDTADCYNPKVVQATMGSIARVSVHYVDLKSLLNEIQLPVLAACMEGSNVYREELPQDAVLVMGNEANGISPGILEVVSKRITIPQFGQQETESLNVATATAILLSEFRRSTER